MPRRVDEAVERNGAPRLDRVQQVLDRGLAPAFAVQQLGAPAVQAEDVGRRLDQVVLIERLDVLVAEPFDVEGAARDEMAQPLHRLGRADEAAGAAPHDLAFLAHGVGAADRALVGELVLRAATLAVGIHHADDLRDHVAGALHDHLVADAHVLARDLVLVVQRGVRDHDAADGDRLQLGDRRQRAGAADLDRDVVERGDRLLGRELVRDRPARRAADETEAVLQREVVDLVDHAVDVVVEVGALLRQLVVERERVVQGLGDAGLGIDREAPFLQPLDRLGMQLRLVVPALHLAHRIGEEFQRPRLGDAGVELAHRAGRGVARVGEHRLALLLALLVQREEGIVREIDLAADLDQRRAASRILQLVRDAGDMLQVRGDVLADRAVAAGRADA